MRQKGNVSKGSGDMGRLGLREHGIWATCQATTCQAWIKITIWAITVLNVVWNIKKGTRYGAWF